MTPQYAISLLTDVTAQVSTTRENHVLIQRALETLRGLLPTPETQVTT